VAAALLSALEWRQARENADADENENELTAIANVAENMASVKSQKSD